MSVEDPLSDLVARIKNAQERQHQKLKMPGSTIKRDIAKVFKEEGYIEDFELEGSDSILTLTIDLKYQQQGKPVIDGLERVSKPSRRVYVSSDEIPRVLEGLGTAVITTSEGVMSGKRARKKEIGGEVLLKIW